MTELENENGTLRVRFSALEKLFALRGDIQVARSAIVRAEVVPDGLATARGIRAPGLSLPGVIKVGTWRKPGEKTYISVRRSRPALSLTMAPGSGWSRLVINCESPHTWAEELATGQPGSG